MHLIPLGFTPWALTFPGAKPTFHAADIGRNLDFVSVHFYPETGKIPEAVKALKTYDIGKPLVIEEMFPLKSRSEEHTSELQSLMRISYAVFCLKKKKKKNIHTK